MHPDLEIRNPYARETYAEETLRRKLAEMTARAHEAESRVNECEAAIRENSVVLLAVASISKNETVSDLVNHVHDSLTDALR